MIKFNPEKPLLSRDIAFTLLTILAKLHIIDKKTFLGCQLQWKVFRPRPEDFE